MSTIPQIPQPFQNFELRPHQLEMILKMEELEERQCIQTDDSITQTKIGINANPGGTGKSVEMLGLVYCDHMEWDTETLLVEEETRRKACGWVRTTSNKRFNRLDITLIVCHPELVHQWQERVQELGMSSGVITNKNIGDLKNFQTILVVGTNMYNSLVKRYAAYAWKRIIYDEPAFARITNMRHARCGFFWLLVGYLPSLEQEYHSRGTGFIGSLVKECEPVGLRQDIPDIILATNRCKQVSELFDLKQPELYAYKNIGNHTQTVVALILKEIGVEITNNIVHNLLEKGGDELLQDEEKTQRIQELGKFGPDKTAECPICMTQIQNYMVVDSNCLNYFCTSCIEKHLRRDSTCPICRQETGDRLLATPVQSKYTSTHKLIVELLSEKKRVVCFCTSKILSNELLSSVPITHRCINTTDLSFKMQYVKEFQLGLIDLLILTTSPWLLGTYEAATDLVIYGNMNQDKQDYITSRILRPGRTADLTIHIEYN